MSGAVSVWVSSSFSSFVALVSNAMTLVGSRLPAGDEISVCS